MTTSNKTGGSVDYYTCSVPAERTIDGRPGYDAQCLEIIETLGMSFAEGEAFKAIWRSCAARTLGKVKADCDALYNAEKVAFYGQRMVVEAQIAEPEAEPELQEGWHRYQKGAPVPAPGTWVDVVYTSGACRGPLEMGYFRWAGVTAYRIVDRDKFDQSERGELELPPNGSSLREHIDKLASRQRPLAGS